MDVLRIGTLGAARIAPKALVRPAREVDGVEVVAVAARDRGRAEEFAARQGVPRVHGSYRELVEDPEIDAVYNPLPNALHLPWTLAALAAGKHVLCEKPLTNNEAEARTASAAARERGLVLMEAFHYRHHPVMKRLVRLVHGLPGEGERLPFPGARGAIGAIQRIEARMCFPMLARGDIRYDYELGGGALMDAGCYAVHAARALGLGPELGDPAAEPEVVRARAKRLRRDPRVDRAMDAELRFPSGVRARVVASLWSGRALDIGLRVIGERGEVSVFNYLAPQAGHRIRVRAEDRSWTEHLPGEGTYTLQLRAFLAAVRDGGPNPTPAEDAIRTMRVVDAVYRGAGMPVRGEPVEAPLSRAAGSPRNPTQWGLVTQLR
ncbi:hypothetical protein BIV57_22010 [Mangrovactinospora gilvigrisea]|uniref:Oxidoreductase n=1 Tax=Mangrovactinospora gilvigrisea TaxID=1428644 RepID=A0A1J7C184_9ACTN|nr:Gfo/Idh/MocA family oxidoreductase [Mangrovactinospora gilvigrisea]OIV35328.1 hypothetical protein BIV57_22010 [Mangrovactinospora gilvigrisea]